MSKRFKKAYLEITNVCNLSCSFCPGTNREKRFLSSDTFELLTDKLRDYTDYLYFHLMGEPLLHPQLEEFISSAARKGFHVCITTNGTLLKNRSDVLLNAEGIHKISISLQAMEANESLKDSEEYLKSCFEFGEKAEGKTILSYRLWNEGGLNSCNERILTMLKEYFPEPWTENRSGFRIGDKVYLEQASVFDWPELPETESDTRSVEFCYGLRDQIGILSDGTLVPCCLDHNGDIPLGNLIFEDMETILNRKRSLEIYNGFSRREAVEKLCRNCGYAERFGNQ